VTALVRQRASTARRSPWAGPAGRSQDSHKSWPARFPKAPFQCDLKLSRIESIRPFCTWVLSQGAKPLSRTAPVFSSTSRCGHIPAGIACASRSWGPTNDAINRQTAAMAKTPATAISHRLLPDRFLALALRGLVLPGAMSNRYRNFPKKLLHASPLAPAATQQRFGQNLMLPRMAHQDEQGSDLGQERRSSQFNKGGIRCQ
jgi:hypothetical protein